jgi:hypothetical protein
MPNYSRSLVTFFDVLGFRKLVEEKSSDGVGNILSILGEYSDAGRKSNLQELRVLAFSDSIIRVRRVDTVWNRKHPSGILFHELLQLVHAQVNLVLNGVLIRGAITIGGVRASAHQIYGPGFNEAYEVERVAAVFPRIVVSPAVLRCLSDERCLVAEHQTRSEALAEVRRLLRQGDDGVWFIDYLRAAEDESRSNEEYVHFLALHRKLIADRCDRQDEGLGSVSIKVNWLIVYHNTVIRGLSETALLECGARKADLMLPPNFHKALFQFR